MALIGVRVSAFPSVCQSFWECAGKLEERDLARTIEQRSKLDSYRAMILDFKNDTAGPAGLNPWRGLVHAESEASVCTPAFNVGYHVPRYGYALVGQSENELPRLQAKRIRLPKRIGWIKLHGLPDSGNAAEAAVQGDLESRNALESRELTAEPQVDRCLSPLSLLERGLERDLARLYGCAYFRLSENHQAAASRSKPLGLTDAMPNAVVKNDPKSRTIT